MNLTPDFVFDRLRKYVNFCQFALTFLLQRSKFLSLKSELTFQIFNNYTARILFFVFWIQFCMHVFLNGFQFWIFILEFSCLVTKNDVAKIIITHWSFRTYSSHHETNGSLSQKSYDNSQNGQTSTTTRATTTATTTKTEPAAAAPLMHMK